MITVNELWTQLDQLAAAPLPPERIALFHAQGRVLREAILAPEDQPAFDRSAVDGYLVHIDQPAGLTTLEGAVHPGSPAPANAPAPGTALRIFTGSALPHEGVALIMKEDTKLSDDEHRLHLLQPPSGRHIRRRGSQARAGDTLLAEGIRLNAGSLALLASIGAIHPLVNRPVRVAHLVTGGELVPPDQTPTEGQIRDCNSTLIDALLRDCPAELGWQHRVDDSREATAKAFDEALATETDIFLISGGSSVGEYDHTGTLLAERGFTIHCDKVASRPGKPFIAASRDGRLAFGLPGNPLSHFVCFHLFVKRVIHRLAGLAPVPLVRATLAPRAELRADPRETWWPCIWTDEGTQRRVLPLPWMDSSDLTILGNTAGLLRVPAIAGPGTEVDVLPCL
ncbi:MAG: molybdopterin molybdotransferase MoeA [Verrucomicrobiota bacterium]